MKNLSFLLIALFTVTSTNAQNWQWQNPIPQGNPLHCVKFFNTNSGHAVGLSGTILKTIDGGTNWTIENSGTCDDLNSVFSQV